MSSVASTRCATRWHRRKRRALRRTSRSTTRCSPRCASAPAARRRSRCRRARASRRPSADASSTGTPSCIAVAASCCSPRAATAAAAAHCFEHALVDARTQGALLPRTARRRQPRAPAPRRGGRATRAACLQAAYARFPRGLDAPDLRRCPRSARGTAMTVDAVLLVAERPGGLSSATPRHASRLHPGGDRSRACGPCSPRMGITRIANVTGLDRIGIPVVMVVRPNARSVAVSQGKGLTLAAAKASGRDGGGRALARGAHHEAAEARELRRDASRAPGRRPGPASARARRRLRPEPAAALDRGARPHGRRAGLGAVRAGQRELHAAASAGQRLLPGQHQRSRLRQPSARGDLPRPVRGGRARRLHTVAALGRRARPPCGRPVVRRPIPTAGGCSTGSPRPTSRCASGTRPATSASPSFCCLVAEASGEFADPEYGNGCHPAREVALLRALTEAAQARLTYIAGARDDFPVDAWEPAYRRRRHGTLRRATSTAAAPAVGVLRQRALLRRAVAGATISTGCSRGFARPASTR